MVPSFVLLVGSLTMGAVLYWDVRGYATRSRQRFEARALDGALYSKLPAWTFRAFGVWCFVFGIGQFIAFYLWRR